MQLSAEEAACAPCLRCAICFEEFLPSSPVRLLPCRHLFHAACIEAWFLRSQVRERFAPLCLSLPIRRSVFDPRCRCLCLHACMQLCPLCMRDYSAEFGSRASLSALGVLPSASRLPTRTRSTALVVATSPAPSAVFGLRGGSLALCEEEDLQTGRGTSSQRRDERGAPLSSPSRSPSSLWRGVWFSPFSEGPPQGSSRSPSRGPARSVEDFEESDGNRERRALPIGGASQEVGETAAAAPSSRGDQSTA